MYFKIGNIFATRTSMGLQDKVIYILSYIETSTTGNPKIALVSTIGGLVTDPIETIFHSGNNGVNLSEAAIIKTKGGMDLVFIAGDFNEYLTKFILKEKE